MKKRRNQYEDKHQIAFFDWVAIKANQDERYDNIIAIPNQGTRGGVRWGQSRRREGLRKGFPDIAILGVGKGYAGAFVELKISPNRPSSEQLDWLRRLKKARYWAGIIWSSQELIDFTEYYIEGKNKAGEILFNTGILEKNWKPKKEIN